MRARPNTTADPKTSHSPSYPTSNPPSNTTDAAATAYSSADPASHSSYPTSSTNPNPLQD